MTVEKKLKESTASQNGWKYIASKSVHDTDGFMTDYTWYRDADGLNVFILGDSDIYEPSVEDADYYCFDRQEAQEWFDSYDEDLNESLLKEAFVPTFSDWIEDYIEQTGCTREEAVKAYYKKYPNKEKSAKPVNINEEIYDTDFYDDVECELLKTRTIPDAYVMDCTGTGEKTSIAPAELRLLSVVDTGEYDVTLKFTSCYVHEKGQPLYFIIADGVDRDTAEEVFKKFKMNDTIAQRIEWEVIEEDEDMWDFLEVH